MFRRKKDDEGGWTYRFDKKSPYWRIVAAAGVLLLAGVAFFCRGTFSGGDGGTTEATRSDTRELAVPASEDLFPAEPADAAASSEDGELFVVIDKTAHRLTVYRGEKELRSFPVAVGKNKGDKERKGDMKTPEGAFEVQQIQNASTWTHDFRDGKGMIPGAYGPYFVRLRTTPWTGIGIHGTHAPESVGTDATEGCIRMYNEEVPTFVEMIAVGTRVVIKP